MKNLFFPVLLIIFSIFINPIYAQDEAWERIIPTPQEHDLYCVRQIPGTSRIVASGRGSTIMFSDDDGNNWDVIINPASLPNSITVTEVSFFNENQGVALTYNGKIILTTDGGQSWELVFEKENYNPNTGYLGYDSNYGDIHFIDEQTIIVASFENLSLRSADGGLSWDTIMSTDDFNPLAIEFINTDTGFIVGASNPPKIFKTTDGGISWSDYEPGFDSYMYCTDINFMNDSLGFIIGSNGRYDTVSSFIYKTENGGESWIKVYGDAIGYSTGELHFQDELRGAAIRHSANSCFIITHDGGNTWEHDPDTPFGMYANIYSFLFMPDYQLVVGRLGSIHKKPNNADEYERLSHNFLGRRCNQAKFVTDLVGFCYYTSATGGIPGGQLIRTTNGGKNWYRIKHCEYEGGFDFITDQNGFLAEVDFDDLILYKTVDGGENWQYLYDFGNHESFMDLQYIIIEFRDSLNGIVAFMDNAYITHDGGISWNDLFAYNFDFDWFASVAYLSEDTIFITASRTMVSVVLRSVDGGQSFTEDTIHDIHLPRKITFTDHLTGYIAFEDKLSSSYSGKIYKTIDGGGNWYETVINDTINTAISSIYFPTKQTGYAVGVGEYSNMYKTEDGGETWNPIDTYCSSGLSHLYFFDDWHGFVFGDNGVILETFSGGVVGLEENPFVANKSNILVYPNPAKNKITIQLEEAPTNDVYLELYNLQGKCLIRKYYPNALLKHNISLDISKLPPGLYTCRVKNGNSQSTSKVVKL